MPSSFVFAFFCMYVQFVISQDVGSGSDGKLRLCIVEGRGSYKRGNKYCPILDEEKSGVECVLGTDRLDCLRRISKGSVDFGVFSPEDLIAARWASVDVLVTNELKLRKRDFSRSIVAVVNRRILPDGPITLSSVLRNRTLCYPVVDYDDIKPLSDTLTQYLESLVTVRSCDPKLSLAENRVKMTADFFGKACRAGPWVGDKARDTELKRKYPSLCAACASHTCSVHDVYWGDSGALHCMAENVGDITWTEVDDVSKFFKLNTTTSRFAYLCRDGTWQPLENNPNPCAWLHKPWSIIVSKRKAAEAVGKLTSSLTNSSALVDGHWHGALAALLEIHQELPEPLHPPLPPMDYLAKATGFTEAYSQHGCDPPRHITLCTTSLLENNKCEWLGEAGAVYGVAPPLQCVWRNSTQECMKAVRDGDSHVVVGGSDWLATGMRDYSLSPIIHEATQIIEKTNTIVAYVRKDANLKKMADLRSKRAAFPLFDGIAYHSVLRYISNMEKKHCNMSGYFSLICAPGIERYNVTQAEIESYTKNCYKEGDKVVFGERQALRAVVEGKSDVAFISMNTYNMYAAKQIDEPWAQESVEITKVCPEESGKFCFVGWSNIGHIFAARNLTAMRRQEIINVFTKLDQLFGKKHVNSLMFSLYGTFNHNMDILFHNNTKTLITDEMYRMRPYNNVPLSFERDLNVTDICQVSSMTGAASKLTPAILLVFSLSLFLYR